MKEATTRKKRSDRGKIAWNGRDIYALTWIAHQYAIRLDHLQRLLATYPGHGAKTPGSLSEGAARNVVSRWRSAGWVKTAFIRAREPFWIWPTKAALRQLGLAYVYKDLEHMRLDELNHLAAVNEIRLRECHDGMTWVSQRNLLQQIKGGEPSRTLPDADLYRANGERIAIKAGQSREDQRAFPSFLTTLLRTASSPYSEVWFMTQSASISREICEICTQMLEAGTVTEEEVLQIVIKGPEEEAIHLRSQSRRAEEPAETHEESSSTKVSAGLVVTFFGAISAFWLYVHQARRRVSWKTSS